jgi:hypothetical protein
MILVYTSLSIGDISNLNVVGFLQQEIAQAADVAVRFYTEVTPFDEKSDQGLADAMRLGAKDRATKLIAKMGKLLAMANPTHGQTFLQEVHYVF